MAGHLQHTIYYSIYQFITPYHILSYHTRAYHIGIRDRSGQIGRWLVTAESTETVRKRQKLEEEVARGRPRATQSPGCGRSSRVAWRQRKTFRCLASQTRSSRLASSERLPSMAGQPKKMPKLSEPSVHKPWCPCDFVNLGVAGGGSSRSSSQSVRAWLGTCGSPQRADPGTPGSRIEVPKSFCSSRRRCSFGAVRAETESVVIKAQAESGAEMKALWRRKEH